MQHATAINPEEACSSRSMEVYEFIRRSENMDLIELIKKENTGIFRNYPVAPVVETTIALLTKLIY
ncbi:hypothetical protein RINTU1_19440 [Candidatus Regiella insecticola]|uniref:Uncharacterized protein n=1 Tax=Candidatus Regiella insecticola TaxID=138073 RepID=A0A6L2ZPC7_9ENTR|nr:hypothetical protein RINTU1_19440 [Candidatus Regiella insecticola]